MVCAVRRVASQCSHIALTQEDPIAPRLLDETLSRVSHCIVAMFDHCSETMEVLSFFLPWMRYNCTTNEKGKLDTRVKGLPEDFANAFLDVNALDEQSFNLAPSSLTHTAQRGA